MQKEPSLFILLILVSFASLSAVLFTPALPQIALNLGISDAKAQLTVTIFLIGYAIGLLPYGPLSNRWGRKPTAYLGICIAILGCLMVLFVDRFHSFSLLIVGRLLMALGSSVGLKIAFTMVGDVYQHEKATKKISYLMLSFAIAPALAIAVGGLLTTHFGWMSCFYFQTVYSFFLLALSFLLPETCSKIDPDALKIKTIAEGYLQKITNKKLVLCAMLMGCGTSVIYLFAAEAPFIGINHIGLSPYHYGLLNFIPPVGLILGSLLANALAGKMEALSTMFLGISIAFFCTAVMLLMFLFGIVNPWSLFVPMPFVYLGESLVYANASSMILSHAKNKSYASATMSFLNMGMSVVTLLIFESLPIHGLMIMPVIFTLTTLVMMLLRRRLSRLA
ncbi:MAG: MFS transporter [Verrucomicrobia bacterium]|nr:MFS transporter [Verrucomicrobiota bacterium]